MGADTQACARGTRFSLGYNLAGLQPDGAAAGNGLKP